MSDSVLLADDHPIDPDDELLVAYLDDELNDEERRMVERRLVAETTFQKRLQALQTGWEWLDELPVESNNEKLVESTIELLVSDILPNRQDERGWLRRHWKSVSFVSVVVLGFCAGVVASETSKHLALTRDLAELEIAEDHQAYKLGEHFSLYYQLAYNSRWQEMIKIMEQLGRREMAPPSVVAAIPIEDRRHALQQLPSETRERLAGRWESYKGYSEEAKAEIRGIAAKVVAANDSEKLLRTMKAASVWLEELNADLRDELFSDDESAREAALDLAIDITMSDLARDSGKLIEPRTSNKIYSWLRLLLQQRIESVPVFAEMVDRLKMNLIEQGRDEQWVEYFLLRSMVDERDPRGRSLGILPGSRGPMLGFGPGGGPGFGVGPRPVAAPREGETNDNEGLREPDRRSQPFARIPPITDAEYRELFELLDDQARADLLALTSLSTELLSGDTVAINETLKSWAMESIRRNAPNDELTALDRYKAREDRELLDLLPPEELLNAVYSRPDRRGPQR